MKHAYYRFIHHFVSSIRVVTRVLEITTLASAILCVIALVIYAGFDHGLDVKHHLSTCVRTVQWVFIVNIVYNLTLNNLQWRKSGWLRWIIDIAMLSTMLPMLYPRPINPWIPWLEQMLYSPWYTMSIIGIYALLSISQGLIKLMGKRTNPSLILSCSFLFFIVIGSFLLMMPRCTYMPISYVDSLFVASSAVCITGLTPIDVASTFTPLGLLIIGLLIQIGALGVMTFTSFFALFFSGNTSIYNQLMVKDMIHSKSMNALLPTLLYILVSTLVIEAIGAVMIYLSVHSSIGLSLHDEIVFSVFTSVSAFCNAGFSNLTDGMANPMLFYGDQSIYLILTVLVMAGAVGFPILVNLKTVAKQYLKRLWHNVIKRQRRSFPVHIYDVNTRIVLITTSIVFIVGASLFFLLERDNTLSGMPLYDQIVQSLFNACTPRSSGFVSVSPAAFLDVTIIVVMFQMWIGGGSQSTAGGVKVNTFAAILLNLRSIVLGRSRVVAFHRTISLASIRRANAVVALSIISYVLLSAYIVGTENGLSVKALLFETASALFTVGSSLGITPMLSTSSKIALCLAMFLGRVGIISLLVGISGNPKESHIQFPEENIIIN